MAINKKMTKSYKIDYETLFALRTFQKISEKQEKRNSETKKLL